MEKVVRSFYTMSILKEDLYDCWQIWKTWIDGVAWMNSESYNEATMVESEYRVILTEFISQRERIIFARMST